MVNNDMLRIRASDRFLAHPLAQPKAGIADHIHQECPEIRQPHRFATFSDGLEKVGKIIIRSEHPQEYSGVSGLFRSHVVSPERIATWRKKSGVIPNDSTTYGMDWSEFDLKSTSGRWPALDRVFAHIGLVPDAQVVAWLREIYRYAAQAYCAEFARDEDPDNVLRDLTYTA